MDFKRFGRPWSLLVSLIICFSSILNASEHSSRFIANEIIVKYKDGFRRNRPFMEDFYDSVKVEKIRRLTGRLANVEHLRLREGSDVQSSVARLRKNPAVEFVHPNYVLRVPEGRLRKHTSFALMADPAKRPPIHEKPSEVNPPKEDPDLDQAYGISKIGAIDAWKTTKGSQNMIVAVIDTGVDYNHEDLSFNMWRNPSPSKNGDIVGWDFVHNDNLPFDDHSHGTHCSGVIGAVGGNGKGISGVSQRVSIMALKFLDSEGSGDTVGAVKAIDYAIEHGAKILSNSWGGKGDDDNELLRKSIQRAEDAGVLFIAAAGNDNTDNDTDPSYPASFNAPNMISVAATDEQDDRAFFSNYGVKTVQLGAPGMNVYSTIPGNKYKRYSGTSMACPHVAGAAALLWSAKPSLSWKEVKAHLMSSVDLVEALKGKTVTGGRLNVSKAISSLRRLDSAETELASDVQIQFEQ